MRLRRLSGGERGGEPMLLLAFTATHLAMASQIWTGVILVGFGGGVRQCRAGDRRRQPWRQEKEIGGHGGGRGESNGCWEREDGKRKRKRRGWAVDGWAQPFIYLFIWLIGLPHGLKINTTSAPCRRKTWLDWIQGRYLSGMDS